MKLIVIIAVFQIMICDLALAASKKPREQTPTITHVNTSTNTTNTHVKTGTDLPNCAPSDILNKFWDDAERLTRMKLIRKDFAIAIVNEIDLLGFPSCITPEGSVACAIRDRNQILVEHAYIEPRNCQRRTVLLYHEIFHMLGLDHESPLSIMQPNMLTTDQWNANSDIYMIRALSKIYPGLATK